MEQISKRNGQFNQIVEYAQKRGYSFEVLENKADENSEFIFVVIRRHSGEVTNYLELANAADVLYVSTTYNPSTGYSSMKIQRSNGVTLKNISRNLFCSTVITWAESDGKVAA